MAEDILYINYSKEKNQNCKIYSVLGKFSQFFYELFLLSIRFILSKIYGKGEQAPPIKNLILMESVTSLAQKIRSKELKSVDVLKAYIERIREINPLLNCVIENRFKDAIIEARQVDELIESRKFTDDQLIKQKPLLGVPFTTKDSIEIKNMLNTAGLWSRKNVRANKDAKTIDLLRKAGAIPIAVTNIPEICMWWESNNTIYGRTNNPYDTSRTVGGSSGGEGCIQTTAGSAFGLGTDIGGSIRIPAIFNGIFGHKPSKLIVSNEGQYPQVFDDEIHSFLSTGPMCRYACDLKLILKVITGEKSQQLNLDKQVDLKNIKIFYQSNDGGGLLVQPVEKSIQNAMQNVVKYFANKFGESPKRIQLEKLRESTAIWFATMQGSNDKDSLDYQMANLQGRINPYIEFGKCLIGNSKHTLIGLINAIIERLQSKYGSDEHNEYVKKRNELEKEIKDLLGDNGVLLYPTHPTVAPYHWEPLARSFNFCYTGIINCMGLPSTAVPLGIGSEGLPLGIQVIANHNQDRLCLAIAEELEKVFGGWTPPSIEL